MEITAVLLEMNINLVMQYLSGNRINHDILPIDMESGPFSSSSLRLGTCSSKVELHCSLLMMGLLREM